MDKKPVVVLERHDALMRTIVIAPLNATNGIHDSDEEDVKPIIKTNAEQVNGSRKRPSLALPSKPLLFPSKSLLSPSNCEVISMFRFSVRISEIMMVSLSR